MDIKDYIKQHKNAFEDSEPMPEMWNSISKKLDTAARHKSLKYKYWLYAAASLILFVSISVITLELMNKSVKDPYPSAQEASWHHLLNNNPEIMELLEAQQYYNGKIETMKTELCYYSSYCKDIQNDLNVEFKELDNEFFQLKKDLMLDANNAQLIEAMILNCRTKAQIMEDVLIQIKENSK